MKAEALLISLLLHDSGTLPLHEAVKSYNILDEYLAKLFKFGDDEKELKRVKKAAIFFLNDSFYTISNLVYKP